MRLVSSYGRKIRYLIPAFTILAFLHTPAEAQKQRSTNQPFRSLAVIARAPGTGDTTVIRLYHRAYAIVIGIDSYPYLTDEYQLINAVADARSVADVLNERFAFDRIFELYDTNATKSSIEKIFLSTLPDICGPDDAVFVYFAGHGITSRGADGRTVGSFIPYDGGVDVGSRYRNISMTDVDNRFGLMVPAKHMLFVFDACFGGLVARTRTRSVPARGRRHSVSYLQDISQEKVREVITAGGADEEVLDAGGGGHSVFTKHLLDNLREADDFLMAQELYLRLREDVHSDALGQRHKQKPLYKVLWGEGEFVFVPRHQAVQALADHLYMPSSTAIPAGKAQIILSVDPPDARVLINGVAPMDLAKDGLFYIELFPGPVALSVAAPGYARFDTILQVSVKNTVKTRVRLLRTGAYDRIKSDLEESQSSARECYLRAQNYVSKWYSQSGSTADESLRLALLNYRAAIEFDPCFAEAYFDRSNLYSQLGYEYIDNAIQDLDQVNRLKPDFARANYQKAHLFIRKGETDKAIDNFAAVIRLIPNYGWAYYDRGFQYLSMYPSRDFLDSAITDFTEAIRCLPQFEYAYYDRGEAFLKRYDRSLNSSVLSSAVRDFSAALGLNENIGPAYYGRGAANIRLSRLNNALSDLDRAVELGTYPRAYVYLERGIAHQKRGEYDAAIDDITKAVSSGLWSIHEPQARYHRGIAFRHIAKYKEAIDDLTSAIDAGYMQNGWTHFERGSVYWLMGLRETDEATKTAEMQIALSDFENAESNGLRSAWLFYQRAMTKDSLGKRDGALADIEEALRLSPNFTLAQDKLSKWRLRGGVY